MIIEVKISIEGVNSRVEMTEKKNQWLWVQNNRIHTKWTTEKKHRLEKNETQGPVGQQLKNHHLCHYTPRKKVEKSG